MTTYLGKSCSFGLKRVHFVNWRRFMYLVISLLVYRAGCGIWLYQFLIIAYLFTFGMSRPGIEPVTSRSPRAARGDIHHIWQVSARQKEISIFNRDMENWTFWADSSRDMNSNSNKSTLINSKLDHETEQGGENGCFGKWSNAGFLTYDCACIFLTQISSSRRSSAQTCSQLFRETKHATACEYYPRGRITMNNFMQWTSF